MIAESFVGVVGCGEPSRMVDENLKLALKILSRRRFFTFISAAASA